MQAFQWNHSKHTSQHDDRGVSPVIAVILMVAITVVLAATVYVWVTQFGANGSTQPGSLGISQSSYDASSTCGVSGATWCAKWLVLTASNGLTLSNLGVRDITTDVGTITCASSGQAATLAAGDVLTCTGTLADPVKGDTWVFTDKAAGSVMNQVTLHA